MSRGFGRRWPWLALGGVALIAALVLAWALQQLYRDADRMPQGGPIELPSTVGEFSLARLDDDQLAVVFFGYTHCPDVCPMSLSVMRQALARLDPETRQRVVPLLISVDPARDDLARLRQYVGFFGPQFIGATGSQAQLSDIADRYGVFWRKVEAGDSAMGYTVDHSASLFIVDSDGEILERVMYSPTPGLLSEALGQVLAAHR
ncbi:SCO family protein [Halomonas sp. McH1-25]|uniref:SCO family protein n=1 Tax=unclassified Halomonas TaxID=2609666 RepID=UPI001EF3E673|nr:MULTISPECIES: SCO family protein [unclassified Halomonas]MCG7599514.1 SCO family protein [Halomonas sp. McH1-25]MCP1343669.1 SCO family protein [Halomonas sp. FL8]MCP1361946.1 SCO family protein [Halomonas sp. BBD45]MCP1367174.1 SCO family protein [Halomonas sp. BBD48]